VFVVAIAELKGSIDDEAGPLATDLGATAYDARLLLAGGTPAVVKTTPDKALALDLLARLRARGHGAVACDAAAVVPYNAMISMRRLRLGETAVTLDDRPGETLAYDAVLALVAAVHRRRHDTDVQTKETKLSVGRAVMTGGLSFTRTVKTSAHATTEERTGVVYVFRRDGGTPWILHEHGTSWAGLAGLGRTPAPSEGENFRLALRALRELSPGATFDERLVTRRGAERAVLSNIPGKTTVTTSSEAGIDLLAHLVAMWVARSPRPFR
jgi:hypothetical protein